jgi:prefoldin subunit 5
VFPVTQGTLDLLATLRSTCDEACTTLKDQYRDLSAALATTESALTESQAQITELDTIIAQCQVT